MNVGYHQHQRGEILPVVTHCCSYSQTTNQRMPFKWSEFQLFSHGWSASGLFARLNRKSLPHEIPCNNCLVITEWAPSPLERVWLPTCFKFAHVTICWKLPQMLLCLVFVPCFDVLRTRQSDGASPDCAKQIATCCSAGSPGTRRGRSVNSRAAQQECEGGGQRICLDDFLTYF